MKALSASERASLSKTFWTDVGANHNPDEFLAIFEANPWLVMERAPRGAGSRTGSPCIHALISEKAWKMVDFCLQNSAPLEARNDRGETVLHSLVVKAGERSRHTDANVLWALIEKAMAFGARCDTVSFEGQPLWYLQNGRLPTAWVNLVLSKGAPVDCFASDGAPLLTTLVQNAHADPSVFGNLASLLRAGANPNAMGLSMENNALFNALELQSQPVVDLLFSHGADPKIKDRFGRGIAHHARSVMTIAWLAGQGVDTDARDLLGQTPLHFALLEDVKAGACGREATLVEMIVRGADLGAGDQQGDALSSTPAKLLTGKNRALWPGIPAVLKSMAARTMAYAALDQIDRPSP